MSPRLARNDKHPGPGFSLLPRRELPRPMLVATTETHESVTV